MYVPHSDDEKIDADILKGKLVFSTFHQVKGLERKIVLIMGFDSSYSTYYDRITLKCPNSIYVATTRAKEKLILLHQHDREFLPYLNVEKLHTTCNVRQLVKMRVKTEPEDYDATHSVVRFLRYLPSDVISTAWEFLSFNVISPKTDFILIAGKTLQQIKMNTNSTTTGDDVIKEIYESVNDINGVAIPAYYEYLTTNNMTIHNRLLTLKDTMTMRNIPIVKFAGKTPTIAELLQCANLYLYSLDKYIYKINQIKEYNWVSEENLSDCMARLSSVISPNALYEVSVNNRQKRY